VKSVSRSCNSISGRCSQRSAVRASATD